MSHMIVLKAICEYYNRWGRAIPIADLKIIEPINHMSRSTRYRVLGDLMDHGFIIRHRRGEYIPAIVYQWALEDYLGQPNA